MRNETVLVTIIYITLLSSAEPIAQNNIPSAVYSVDNHSEATDKNEQLIDRTRLETAIRLSANYLHEICSQNGRFTYLINTNPKVIPHSAYNILRHAGTVYALAMFRQWSFDDSNNEAIIRAAHFILRETVAPVPGRVDLLAVGSDPDITDRQRPVAAKLGGTGLGLVALLSVEKIEPGTVSIDTLRKLGRFLLYMQKKDGSFYSHYIPEKGGKIDRWASEYYSGEAVLGLLMLYEKDNSSLWLQAAADGLAYLARSRSNEALVQINHWFLLAAARLFPVNDYREQSASRELIFQHAVQICESILSQDQHYARHSTDYGCLTDDGRTCPTAARLEGLLAALTFIPEEQQSLRERIVSAVHRGIDFLLRAQIRSGEYIGGIPWAIRPLSAGHPRYRLSFKDRATEIRIDYVQHVLSTMIQYDKTFYQDSIVKESK